tara:strand:+ start:117 stop:617 length:501 start_codon:yes stop_codon:yes gene_type:complete
MKILTVDNKTYELDDIPEVVDDLRYGVLDYSNPKNVDYYFIPLVFLESFYSPAAVLQIGDNTLSIPLDWSLVICDPEVGEPEVVNLMALNDRGFHAFTINPITGFKPEFIDVQITNVYTDIKWYSPKLKFGHLLVVPIEDGDEPRCALFVKESNKIPEVLDINQIW